MVFASDNFCLVTSCIDCLTSKKCRQGFSCEFDPCLYHMHSRFYSRFSRFTAQYACNCVKRSINLHYKSEMHLEPLSVLQSALLKVAYPAVLSMQNLARFVRSFGVVDLLLALLQGCGFQPSFIQYIG